MNRKYLYYAHIACYLIAAACLLPAIRHPILFLPAVIFIFSGEAFLFYFYNSNP